MAAVDTTLSVKVVNLRATIAHLEKLGVEVQDLKEAFGKISTHVAETAKEAAPVRTGRLRAGIRGSNRKNAAVITSRQPVAGRPYHRYMYYGITPGRKIAPRPYLHIAAERDQAWVRSAVVANVNLAIARSGL